ncbi:hypothetical protein BH11MYX2_BH11MYX2_11610 [soil metagenome]
MAGIASFQTQRTVLLAKLGESDQRLAAMRTQLVKEQEDVAEVRRLMQGALLQNMKSVLEKELREAAEAAARLQTALAGHGDLIKQLEALDRAISMNDPVQVAREAAAKRATSEIAAMSDRTRDFQLMDLAARIEAIDIELQPLTAALQAAHAATSSLADAVHSIADARRDGAKQERTEQKLILDAQTKRDAFFAALRELPAPDDVSPRIVDSLEAGDRAPYTEGLGPRLARMGELSERVRKRHAEVAQRRLAFETQRSRVLQS